MANLHKKVKHQTLIQIQVIYTSIQHYAYFIYIYFTAYNIYIYIKRKIIAKNQI